jgi:hypothetical protein
MPEHCPHCGVQLPAIRDAFCSECGNDLAEILDNRASPANRGPARGNAGTEFLVNPASPAGSEDSTRRKPPSVWIAQGLLLLLVTFGVVRVLIGLSGFRLDNAGAYAAMLARNFPQLAIVLWPAIALQRRHRYARPLAGVVLLAIWGIWIYATFFPMPDALHGEDSALGVATVAIITLLHGGMALLILRLCFGRAARAYLSGRRPQE